MKANKLNESLIDLTRQVLEDSEYFNKEEVQIISKALEEYTYYTGEREEAIYNFEIDCGRMGSLEGVFTAKKTDVEWLLNSGLEVYFGEVLGKYSEIYSVIKPEHLEMVTDDPKYVNSQRDSGFNPFDYTVLDGEDDWTDLTVSEIIELEQTKKS